MPTPRSGLAAAALGGRIFVFGGEQPAATFPQNESFDPVTDAWATHAPLPSPRHGLGAVALGNAIHTVAGGGTPGGSASNLHEIWSPAN